MRQFFLVLCLFVTFSNQLLAQEGIPVYFDYLSDNYYLVHPSMAGIGEGGKIRLTARKQWFDVDDAPNLQTFNAHFRVGSNSGVGGILFNDANGYHSQTGVKLTYAHHLKFGGDERSLNQLSFGLSPSIILSSLDETEFRSIDIDPLVTGVKNTTGYFNVDIGMSYNFLEFYAHATILNVLDSQRQLYFRDDTAGATIFENNNLRRYLLSVGYVFGKSEWQLEPSVLFQLSEFTNEKAIDINAKVYKDVDFGKIWGGVSYRRSFDGAQFSTNGSAGAQRLQLFTPIVGANYKKFLFSYNYSYQTGDIRIGSGGFHQITLGYDFGQSEKRYNCNCPAINY